MRPRFFKSIFSVSSLHLAFLLAPLFGLFAILACPYIGHAQSVYNGTAVATSFQIVEAVNDGDIISFDPKSSTYKKTRITGDENMVGVVAKNPTLSLTEDGQTILNGDIPVLRFGEAMVTVSTINGPIFAGDYITSSIIPGVGRKATYGEKVYILGKALEPFSPDGSRQTVAVDGKEIQIGKIPVALRIGLYAPITVGEGPDNQQGEGTGELKDNQIAIEKGTAVFTLNRIMRYILAALIALVTLYVTFRSFKGSMKQSIISVGRNPLAKVSILSMVVLNTLLIIAVSIVALLIGAIIIFAP